MIFIRHAEPDSEGNITPDGLAAARSVSLPMGQLYTSQLPRSQQTMKEIFPGRHFYAHPGLNEWDKNKETADQFKLRVSKTLKDLKDNSVVVGHARWMTWAHWLLKGEVALGFDYLESFEA